ncbi:WD40-repeat-containing domain protein [Helicostylum pulchrum]|nr:WD40-repeat-containing domain protein [Helicostylum pulchrum]
MSLLDKITGLALKAKDNVISKTFISKDKRLEQSLSDSIKVNDIYFEKMSTYGLPSAVNVVAFDCVAGLLAVAGDSNHGYIKVFGKGISTTIKLPKPVGIKHLQFKTGFPILVVIDKSNHIITIDLRTKSIRHVLEAQEIITTQAYCPGTDWLFIGYANGYIDVFDIMQGTITAYQIPDLLDALDEPAEEKSHIVVDLQVHPTELNTLLIGYESTVFIWNIRENTIRRSFSLRRLDKSNPYRNANLTSVAWSPNGQRFMCGYDDGCIHLWDIKNDQKPISSRKLSETFLPHHKKENNLAEPIYQIAWYVLNQKSFVIVAGGTDPADLKGLNILEFDLESESKEPKKQSIMPLDTDLSHFVILSTEPYYSGMHNPFGIAVVGQDLCLRAYSFDHGFPQLKLPPALEFLGPNVLNACHLPQLPTDAYKKLSSITTIDRRTRYFPITGGVAGSDHVYHIDSNDILLTIHRGEVVKFWDASYTALRPLSHLTINCLEHIETAADVFLCCIDINKETGAFTVGFSDGTILVYQCQIEQPEDVVRMDPRLKSRNEEFIDHCDDTLKEISDLLEDMHDSDSEQQQHHNEPVVEPENTSTNPFVTPSPTHHQVPKKLPVDQAPETPAPKKSKVFKTLERVTDSPGFYASLRIQLNSPIKSVVSIGDSIIAAALDNGSVTVIDTDKQMVLFTHNIAQSDFHNTVVIPAANLKSEVATELQEADPISEEQKKPATVTTLSFFNTYSPSKVMTPTTQLFVGLSNGHVYQFNLSLLIEKGPSIASTDLMNDYLTLRLTPDTPLLEMLIIDLKGKSQLALNILEPTLSKENSHHSTDSVPDDESSPKPSSIVSSSSGSAVSANTSKRMAAIGKAEYRHQDKPHLIRV